MSTEKDLNYWKANAEEDYKQVPINVLRYITELETAVKNCSIPDVGESSWAYYEKELDKIEQLNQTQSSLHKQMFILRHFANKLGLYDVADYLK